MSKDHFISCTFLKHFCQLIDENKPRNSKIIVYDKKMDCYRETKIESEFYEKNLDGSKVFSEDLSSHEGSWDQILEKLNNFSELTNFDLAVKKEIVSYLLLLNFNNPKKSKERSYILKNDATLEEKEYITNNFDGFGSKKLRIQVRDILLYRDVEHANELKNTFIQSPWVLFQNETTIPFITSDNPIMVTNHGWYIPLSKKKMLLISKEHEQSLRSITNNQDIYEINNIMKENAERFCACASSSNIFS